MDLVSARHSQVLTFHTSMITRSPKNNECLHTKIKPLNNLLKLKTSLVCNQRWIP
jgi:hypothetical protein